MVGMDPAPSSKNARQTNRRFIYALSCGCVRVSDEQPPTAEGRPMHCWQHQAQAIINEREPFGPDAAERYAGRPGLPEPSRR